MRARSWLISFLIIAESAGFRAEAETNVTHEIWGAPAPSTDKGAGFSEFRGRLYVSGNGKSPWEFNKSTRIKRVRIFYSPDKTRMAVVPEDGPIYASTNSGMNWTVFDEPGDYRFPISRGADGLGFDVTITLESGIPEGVKTNTSGLKVPADNWYVIGSATDGSKLMMTGGPSLESPALNIKQSGGAVIISWPAAFSGFVLQQNPDLTSTNWIDVDIPPSVVQGENQVIVSSPAGRSFYRLRSR